MHAVQITTWGSDPVYTEVLNPPTPLSADMIQIKVRAVALHNLVRARAAGKHFSAKTLPHVPGTDGVGTMSEGQLVYFSTFFTGGSFADVVNVPRSQVCPLPAGLDDPVKVAAMLNPSLSGWMAMKTRVANLPPEFTVLILGATSTSGIISASLARSLGAKRVIGVARGSARMSALGLDDVISFKDPVEDTNFSNVGDVDVILDFVYGPAALALLQALKSKRSVQYVQIGTLGAPGMQLPGMLLREKDITIRGCGPGSWNPSEYARELPLLLEALKTIEPMDIEVRRLEEVTEAWNAPDHSKRIVFLTNPSY